MRPKRKLTHSRRLLNSRQHWKDAWKLALAGHAAFWDIHQHLREGIRQRWNRGLPFNEELFDRWERAGFLGFGKGTSIYDSSLVMGNVKVGRHTWIGPFTILDGSGGLRIGNYCSISAGVHIYTHSSIAWSLTGGKATYKKAPVKIGDCCYIGPNAIVARGVKIGPYSIVAANSFVRDNVAPHTMAAGNPAQAVGRVLIRGKRFMIKRF